MKKYFLGILAILCIVQDGFSQDFYSPEERTYWLQQAEAFKPALSQTNKYPQRLVTVLKDENAYQGWRAEMESTVASFYKTSLKKQDCFILDFGEHITGYFSFSLSPQQVTPDAPARIKFTFGEVPSEMMTPFEPYTGGLSRAWLQDEIVTVMTVPDTITLSRRLSFRYVKVELLHAPNYDFTISEMSCQAVTSASTEPKPLPTNTSSLIKEIDRVGLNTLRECMQTVYEDGPKRDQRLWIGDLYLEALANTYSFQQHDLTKRCLYLLAGLADESGFLNGTVFERPYPHPQSKQLLLDYALLYNVSAKDYLEATGDRQTVEDLWKVISKQVEIASLYLQDNGLMDFEKATKEWWVFIDWRDGLHREVALQGITIFGLTQTYELACMLGREKELAYLPGMIKKMKNAAKKYFYNKKTGLFAGVENKQVSYLSQVWMVLSGVSTKAESQQALSNLKTAENVVHPGTPYAYHYYIQALLDCGLNDEARDALVVYWGGMIKKGADTFWEAYDPVNDFISPYNFHPMNSYCHAWSCTPVYFIRKYPEIFQIKDKPVSVIFETDMGNDVDDALALDMLYKYREEGRLNCLMMATNKKSENSSGYLDIMNTWYGHTDIPIGIVVNGIDGDNTDNFVRAVCELKTDGKPVFERTIKNYNKFPKAVSLYRKVLAAQPDSSVNIVSVGFSTNLAQLLDSPADKYSPLTGKELVAKKVKLLSTMMGHFADPDFAEFNVKCDIPAAQKIVKEWPTEIVVSPFEVGDIIHYPASSIENDFNWTKQHPLVVGYENYLQMPYDRPTWDLTSLLYVVEKDLNMFDSSGPGKIVISDEGITSFTAQSEGTHSYLKVTPKQAEVIQEYFVNLITRKPAKYK